MVPSIKVAAPGYTSKPPLLYALVIVQVAYLLDVGAVKNRPVADVDHAAGLHNAVGEAAA